VLTLGAILLALFVVPSPWGWMLVLTAALVDVAETVVLVRWSRRRSAAVGSEALRGRRGVVTARLAPDGRVRVAGELWAARAAGRDPIEPGAAVVVDDVDGLTLVVVPPDSDTP
jgi:membrane protein implicated in regulation of membrane protease activity